MRSSPPAKFSFKSLLNKVTTSISGFFKPKKLALPTTSASQANTPIVQAQKKLPADSAPQPNKLGTAYQQVNEFYLSCSAQRNAFSDEAIYPNEERESSALARLLYNKQQSNKPLPDEVLTGQLKEFYKSALNLSATSNLFGPRVYRPAGAYGKLVSKVCKALLPDFKQFTIQASVDYATEKADSKRTRPSRSNSLQIARLVDGESSDDAPLLAKLDALSLGALPDDDTDYANDTDGPNLPVAQPLANTTHKSSYPKRTPANGQTSIGSPLGDAQACKKEAPLPRNLNTPLVVEASFLRKRILSYTPAQKAVVSAQLDALSFTPAEKAAMNITDTNHRLESLKLDSDTPNNHTPRMTN